MISARRSILPRIAVPQLEETRVESEAFKRRARNDGDGMVVKVKAQGVGTARAPLDPGFGFQKWIEDGWPRLGQMQFPARTLPAYLSIANLAEDNHRASPGTANSLTYA